MPYAPSVRDVLTSAVEAIGIPSITYKGVLSPVKEREPRMVILEEAPGIPDEGVMSIPDTFPCNAPAKSVLAARVSTSDFTSCTAYPNAFFSREIPIAVTTISSNFCASAFSMTFKVGLIMTS